MRAAACSKDGYAEFIERSPVFVHWLGLKKWLIIAKKLRGIGSSLAERICPELTDGSGE